MASQATATHIAFLLSLDPEVQLLTEGRVLDADYRMSGWNTAPIQVLDSDGLMKTTLACDDNGSMPPFASPVGEEGELFVWGFSNRSATGRQQVDTLMRRVKALLHNYHDPETRQFFRFTFRLGSQTVDDGVFDRLTFRVAGIDSTS